MGLIKVELDSDVKTHLHRFMKFMGTEWANKNVDGNLGLKGGEQLGDSPEAMNALIAKYVEWLEAGEPA